MYVSTWIRLLVCEEIHRLILVLQSLSPRPDRLFQNVQVQLTLLKQIAHVAQVRQDYLWGSGLCGRVASMSFARTSRASASDSSPPPVLPPPWPPLWWAPEWNRTKSKKWQPWSVVSYSLRRPSCMHIPVARWMNHRTPWRDRWCVSGVNGLCSWFGWFGASCRGASRVGQSAPRVEWGNTKLLYKRHP